LFTDGKEWAYFEGAVGVAVGCAGDGYAGAFEPAAVISGAMQNARATYDVTVHMPLGLSHINVFTLKVYLALTVPQKCPFML